jgi:hypothetical protein
VSNLPLLDYLHEKKANVTVFDNRWIWVLFWKK